MTLSENKYIRPESRTHHIQPETFLQTISKGKINQDIVDDIDDDDVVAG